jgi:hypothetical protein
MLLFDARATLRTDGFNRKYAVEGQKQTGCIRQIVVKGR